MAQVLGIEPTQELAQLGVGVDVEVHLPGAQVVAEERVDRRGELHPRLERGTGERQPAALGRAGHADSLGIDLREVHHDPRQLHAVEEDLPIQQFARAIEQAANDVSLERIADDTTDIFRAPALAATVERGHTEPLRHVGQERKPLGAAAGVAMEHNHGGERVLGEDLRAQVFGVDARSAHSGEAEIEAVRKACRVGDGLQLDVAINFVQFAEGVCPVRVHVGRPRVATLILAKLVERHLENWHE